MLSISKHQLQKFIGCLKMSTNNEPKEGTNYTITPLKYYALTRRPCVKIDGHFSVLEAEKPELPDGMKYKVEFLTGTNNRNFYKDLEEIISTMEHENEKFSKHTVLKRVFKIPNSDNTLEQVRLPKFWKSMVV